jgi:hypothetical protein
MMMMQKNKKKVRVKMTPVIDDFIFVFAFLHLSSFILHLHVLDFIMLANLLTTHN